MSSLVSISSHSQSTGHTVELAKHEVRSLPVVVLMPHNQCNCRCAMCDIWRIREPQQLTLADIEKQLTSFRHLGVRWVTFSGGEAQLNTQLALLAQLLRLEGIRVTLLTAGLLLEQEAELIAGNVDDVIVSLDGPSALHDKIRRVPQAFERLVAGVRMVRRFRPDIEIRARCTVQKANHRALCSVVQSAKGIGLNSVSFLAADLTSAAFNRAEGWSRERQDRIALSAEEVQGLDHEIERLISEHKQDVESGFVIESVGKLRRIVQHFRAQIGQAQPIAPRCNAPWVSTVVEASGDVRPCFFHSAYGNIHNQPLEEIVNNPEALRFRAGLDVATDPTCRRCVCSLHIPSEE